MKRILSFLLLLAVFASCADDKAPASGQLTLELSELSLPGASVDTVKTVQLLGGTGPVTATVDPAAANWCEVAVEQDTKSAGWALVVTANKHLGNDERKAYITVKSGIDEIQLTVIQGGRGKSVRMVVVNEGQFTKGTAALTAIAYDGSTTFDIFRDVNENRPLGDVGQSITYINGYYFVTLNNSKKIEVVELQTFKSVATIGYDKAGSPRFIQSISETEAIVSDLNHQLVRIDTKNFKVLDYIDLSATGVKQIEKMTVVGNKLFGAAPGKGVGVFDNNNISGSSMRLVKGLKGNIVKTAKMIVDKNKKLWVLTTQNSSFDEEKQALLNCINTETETVERIVKIPFAQEKTAAYVNGAIVGTDTYARMDTDRSKGMLYFYMDELINATKGTKIGAIFTLDVDKDAISATPYRELPGLGMMYGMGISPDGDVFLCDCLDYTAQRGFLREYKTDGSVDSKRVGIYPRMVHFTEYDQ